MVLFSVTLFRPKNRVKVNKTKTKASVDALAQVPASVRALDSVLRCRVLCEARVCAVSAPCLLPIGCFWLTLVGACILVLALCGKLFVELVYQAFAQVAYALADLGFVAHANGPVMDVGRDLVAWVLDL